MTSTSKHQAYRFPLWSLALWLLAAVCVAPALTTASDTSTTPADTEAPTVVASQRTGESTRSHTTGAIISLQGEINDILRDSLKRRIQEAKALGATIIVLDMDTPGGLVTSTIDINDIIISMPEMEFIAWINPDAYSGGTAVALACDEIVMSRSSRMGDSQVIMGGPEGAQAVPEDLQPKAYTPVLHEFSRLARLRGYDENLCESFVLPDREVWWLENVETGERRFVFREEKLRLLNEEPDEEAVEEDDEDNETAMNDADDGAPEVLLASAEEDAAVGDDTPWRLVETYEDQLLGVTIKAQQPVVRDDLLLQMSASEAMAYGFCKAVVTSESDLTARYGVSDWHRFDRSWSESFASWLTSVYVRGFLLIIIMLGAYVEFHTPGVGVAGLAALIALAIFVGAPYLAGLANVWEILLIVLGFVLIALELFVIPGFGLAGISGAVLLLIGLIATFVPGEPGKTTPFYIPSLPATISWMKTAVLTVASSMIASIIGMFMLSKYLPRIRVFDAIAPANPTPSEVTVEDPYRGAARIGDVGVAIGPLRPAGKARFGSMLVDVVTQGDYLDNNTQIEVIERRGNRVVVRAVRT